MPASDFSWSLQTNRQPLFQVCGTKRKISNSGDNGSMAEEEFSFCAKRQCVKDEVAVTESHMTEINHNDTVWQDQNCMQAQQQGMWSVAMTPQGAVLQEEMNQQSILAQVHVQQPQSQLTCTVISHNTSPHDTPVNNENDMIMDLNDETYSTANINLYQNEELAYSAMDSDCVPNPDQYNVKRCDNDCAELGSYSPLSGRIRCFCRPNWDITEMKPYVSDYY